MDLGVRDGLGVTLNLKECQKKGRALQSNMHASSMTDLLKKKRPKRRRLSVERIVNVQWRQGINYKDHVLCWTVALDQARGCKLIQSLLVEDAF